MTGVRAFIPNSPLTAPLDPTGSAVLSDAGKARIVIYDMFNGIFGRTMASWAQQLRSSDYACMSLRFPENHHVAIDFPEADVHIFALGHGLAINLAEYGMPSKGKTVAWVWEPFTADKKATIHSHKYVALLKVIQQSDAVLAMHDEIADAIHADVAGTTPLVVPCTLPVNVARNVPPETAKALDVLTLQTLTPRRTVLCNWLACNGLPMIRLEGYFDNSRYDTVARSRLSLNIHPDGLRHFAQFRIIDAFATGCPILSEPFPCGGSGLVDGENIVMADVKDMPAIGHGLLSDPDRRMAIAKSAQGLFIERYTTEAWIKRMVAFLEEL